MMAATISCQIKWQNSVELRKYKNKNFYAEISRQITGRLFDFYHSISVTREDWIRKHLFHITFDFENRLNQDPLVALMLQ